MKYKLLFVMLLVSLSIGCSRLQDREVMRGEVKNFKYINHSAGTSDVTIIIFKDGTKISLIGIRPVPCKHIIVYSIPSANDCYIIKPDWDKIYLKEIRR